MGAFSSLYSLSAEQKQLLKSKQIYGEHTPDKWLQLLTPVARYDVEGDKARGWGCGLSIAGLIISIISIPLMSIVIGFVTLPIALLMLIGGFIVYYFLKGYDLPGQNLSKTVIPMLMILREEMEDNEKLKLRLDLRGFETAEKKTGESKPYQKGAYHNVIDYYYRDHWMEGQATLGDGTRIRWSLYDLARNSKKTKRTPRGKTKTKTKTKNRSYIAMQIGMKNEKYALQDGLKQKGQEGKIEIKDSGKRSWVTISRTIKHPIGESFGPEHFVNAIAVAYKKANPTGGKQ